MVDARINFCAGRRLNRYRLNRARRGVNLIGGTRLDSGMCQSRGITRRIFDDATVQFKCIRYDADATQVGEVLSDGVGEDEPCRARTRCIGGINLCPADIQLQTRHLTRACTRYNVGGLTHGDRDADFVAGVEVGDGVSFGQYPAFVAQNGARNLRSHGVHDVVCIGCCAAVSQRGSIVCSIFDAAAIERQTTRINTDAICVQLACSNGVAENQVFARTA